MKKYPFKNVFSRSKDRYYAKRQPPVDAQQNADLATLKSKVKKLYKNMEYKFRDKTATANLSVTARVDPLTEIAEGDASLNRDGLKITPHSLYLNYQIIHPSDEAAASQTNDPKPAFHRVMVVRDLQQVSDTNPSAATVVESTPDFAIAGLSRLSGTKRFQVLYDKRHKTTAQNSGIIASKYINLKGKVSNIQYNGAASTDIQKNGLYVIAGTSFDSATNYNNAIYELFARFRFTDN